MDDFLVIYHLRNAYVYFLVTLNRSNLVEEIFSSKKKMHKKSKLKYANYVA